MDLVIKTSIAICASYFLFACLSLYQNVKTARKTGVRYTIAPVHISNKFWLGSQKLLLPLLDRLPDWMTKSWLPVSVYDRIWRHGFAPFAYHQSSTILVVSPFKLALWTSSPVAVQDMIRRRSDIVKPTEELSVLNVHGPTVTASEGEQARRYRKITTGCFSHAMFEHVWSESIAKADILVRRLVGSEEMPGRVKKELELVTFAVVSQVCFGISVSEEGEMILKEHKPHMGRISYWESFAQSAENMGITFLTPKAILKNSPFKMHKTANISNEEWAAYMEDMIEEKRRERERGKVPKTPNLLDSLYSASIDPDEPLEHEAILGNIWVFVLGGFHTSSNTLHFIFILLAIHPSIQSKLQASIDEFFKAREPSTWTHSEDFPAFLNSHVGAVIAETLRCFGVLPWIPKTTSAEAAPLLLETPEGDTVTTMIPPHTLVIADTSAVHRNPKYWPNAEKRIEGEPEPYAVSSWNPWRWLQNSGNTTTEDALRSDGELKSLSTSGWKPGSYIPFSDGARACIGKRFAQTELCAVLACVMRECSVELVTKGEGRDHWLDARQKAAVKLNLDVGITLALELKSDVPLRFSRRRHGQTINGED
ncbi:cytochrome P450 [Massariosphaeria phaeospora]|uniref:Cytochrome P450 n=1 Tax=Massariosphaeria phaeospora TaxID=100035 RepID=A0A7C8MK58_9PLEO|nr:cytochrome P450 [Massariosphaeria phaeospora]